MPTKIIISTISDLLPAAKVPLFFSVLTSSLSQKSGGCSLLTHTFEKLALPSEYLNINYIL